MHAVSPRFLSAIAGPHRIAARALLLDASPQFGPNPTGTPIPILDEGSGSSLELTSLTDIKGTLTLTVPGSYWDQVQPYGTELYISRGVTYADGDTEMVGLGYFRIEQLEQDNAPFGPIKITALDRIAQLQQNKLIFPLPLLSGVSHRAVFQQLINGIPINPALPTSGYPAYLYSPIPITWPAYDPDATTIIGDQIVEADSYSFLSTLISYYNCVMKFNSNGALTIPSVLLDSSTAVATLQGGGRGLISSAKRVSSRSDVYNSVTAYGSDPTAITDFITTFNTDTSSPLLWNKKTYPAFGLACTYYNSPLLQNNNQVIQAGGILLERFSRLPTTFTLTVVPNPALEPNDVIDVIPYPGQPAQRCIIDTMTIPLTAGTAGQLTTRIPLATEGYSLGLGSL